MGKEKGNNGLAGVITKDAKIIQECAASGEPIFVFRAKDLFSVMVIREYQKLIEEYGPDDGHMITDIEVRLSEFKSWQRENVTQVRYPD